MPIQHKPWEGTDTEEAAHGRKHTTCRRREAVKREHKQLASAERVEPCLELGHIDRLADDALHSMWHRRASEA
eukprot:2585838-Prymnesium_polylepis.3